MKKKRGVSGKAFAILLAVVLAIGCVIGGTVAWLVDDTEPVVNTFTYGDINIKLTETTGLNYRILPGNNIEKDPLVTVKADSEDCWLFVKIEEENWPAFTEAGETTRKVRYEVADGWTALAGNAGVYYRAVNSGTADQDFQVLDNDTVVVSENLTKAELDSIKVDGKLPQPTLTFTTYAVQRDNNINTADSAWSKVTAPNGTP